MIRTMFKLGVVVALAALVTLSMSGSALAHERREVGAYTLVVGFINEPAFVEEPNGVDFRVTRTSDGTPVEGLEKTVKVAISYAGGKFTDPAPLQTRFRMPGYYTLHLFPTKAGEYTFHFTGDIEGTKVDEKFVSGPGRFNHVEAKTALMVPEKLPSIGELASKVSTVESRVSSSAVVEPERTEASTASVSATDGTARAIGAAGLVVGAIGLIAAVLAWTTRSRPAT